MYKVNWATCVDDTGQVQGSVLVKLCRMINISTGSLFFFHFYCWLIFFWYGLVWGCVYVLMLDPAYILLFLSSLSYLLSLRDFFSFHHSNLHLIYNLIYLFHWPYFNIGLDVYYLNTEVNFICQFLFSACYEYQLLKLFNSQQVWGTFTSLEYCIWCYSSTQYFRGKYYTFYSSRQIKCFIIFLTTIV